MAVFQEMDLKAIHQFLWSQKDKITIFDQEYLVHVGLGGARHILVDNHLFSQEIFYCDRSSPVTSIWAFGEGTAGWISSNNICLRETLWH